MNIFAVFDLWHVCILLKLRDTSKIKIFSSTEFQLIITIWGSKSRSIDQIGKNTMNNHEFDFQSLIQEVRVYYNHWTSMLGRDSGSSLSMQQTRSCSRTLQPGCRVYYKHVTDNDVLTDDAFVTKSNLYRTRWEERVLWFLSGLQHDVERRWWQRRRRRRDNITRRPQHVFLLSMRTLLDILRISYFTNRRIAREDKENELCHSNDIVRVWSVSFNVSSDGGPK